MIIYQQLVGLTFRAPTQAARLILSFRWPREALFLALMLTAVLNSLILELADILMPTAGVSVMEQVPALAYAGAVFGLHLCSTLVMTWTGRWIGGQGGFFDILAVTIWLNVVQIALLVAVVLLHLVMPLAASLVALVTNFVMLAIFLVFIKEAHKFTSIWRSIGTVVMSAIVVVLLLTLLLGAQAPALLGLPDHV
ncbi:YIP1 family protein [Phaeobacter porticola]|uniref:Yip1 domain protein n=1 Tax=Phaeobacter porticola TaxID=1844006 RepID=A0A1L3I4N2_9RHOB|nr:YIP1 family protein [Phaeobacter porticola]APG46972.1 Yip1 domain protein [Phaeobacter porticola]